MISVRLNRGRHKGKAGSCGGRDRGKRAEVGAADELMEWGRAEDGDQIGAVLLFVFLFF